MSTVFSILGMIVGIGSLVCLIMVLIKLFKEKGVLHLILGIICPLYPFIWGWMHVTRLNIKNIMLAWSGCAVVQIIFNVIGSLAAQS